MLTYSNASNIIPYSAKADIAVGTLVYLQFPGGDDADIAVLPRDLNTTSFFQTSISLKKKVIAEYELRAATVGHYLYINIVGYK